MNEYAKDVLVSTEWVEERLADDPIRIVEVDENPDPYSQAHIPGAIDFDWKRDFQDLARRHFLSAGRFAELMDRLLPD